jgi:hypothetical protein
MTDISSRIGALEIGAVASDVVPPFHDGALEAATDALSAAPTHSQYACSQTLVLATGCSRIEAQSDDSALEIAGGFHAVQSQSGAAALCAFTGPLNPICQKRIDPDSVSDGVLEVAGRTLYADPTGGATYCAPTRPLSPIPSCRNRIDDDIIESAAGYSLAGPTSYAAACKATIPVGSGCFGRIDDETIEDDMIESAAGYSLAGPTATFQMCQSTMRGPTGCPRIDEGNVQ